MCFGAFAMNFMIWLLVYQRHLTLYHILSYIVIYLLMSFYIEAPFILFLRLHHYYQHLCRPPLPLLPNVRFLVLIAAVPLLNGAGAGAYIVGGGICAPPQLSMELSLLEVTIVVSSSNNVGIGSIIAQIGSRAE
jgi:hypothetical protein